MSAILFAAGILSRVAAIRPLYLAVWLVAAVLSVALIVSLRSRWGRKEPLYRCAVLSLVVHLVLVCLTMTVRLVVGDGGAGIGPPIHVRLVDDVERAGPITLAVPPAIEEEVQAAKEDTAKRELPPPKVADAPEPVFEPPPLLEPPKPAIEKKIVVGDAVAPPLLAAIEDPALEAAKPVEPRPELPTTPIVTKEAPTGSPVDTEGVGKAAPATSPYAHRNAPDRLEYAEQHGGSVDTEAAVAAALEWLAEAQSDDGRWDASRYGAGIEREVLGENRGGAGADADSGISALALLAFLGAGHSHQEGDYRSTVGKGLEFLVHNQAADGQLASETSLYARMYCHAMASFALAEALAMTGDKRLEPAVRRAVAYSLSAQHPSTGGWRYRMGDTGDTSQLGWQLMALWSAERAGIKIPPQTWTGAERFLRSVRRGRQGGLASYRPDGPPTTPMTAEALYCRQVLGDTLGGGSDEPATREAIAQLVATLPEPKRVNLYYWYYGTLALHHQQQANNESAAAWQAWNSALTSALLQAQVADGPEAGSWEPNCVWGGYGGRVYSTAVAALCLEVYYRYAPEPKYDGWTASRPDVRRLPK